MNKVVKSPGWSFDNFNLLDQHHTLDVSELPGFHSAEINSVCKIASVEFYCIFSRRKILAYSLTNFNYFLIITLPISAGCSAKSLLRHSILRLRSHPAGTESCEVTLREQKEIKICRWQAEQKQRLRKIIVPALCVTRSLFSKGNYQLNNPKNLNK